MRIEDFNFVYLSNPYFGYDFAFLDFSKLSNLITIRKTPSTSNHFINKFYKYHHSKKLNKLINLPFKSLWFKFYLRFNFKTNKPLCFIVNILWTGSPELEYLKAKYPNAKFILHISDAAEGEKELSKYLDKYQAFFNLIITYDEPQAKKYKTHYFPQVHSYIERNLSIIKTQQTYPYSDVYFCGRAINRLDKLLSAYEYLTNNGLTCDFYITDVWPKDQKYADKIHYNKNLSYVEHLNHLINSNCVLYIQQLESNAYEWRIINAVMYGKKIITNVSNINSAPFFNPTDIHIFDEPEEINVEFLNHIEKPTNYHYDNMNFSPLRLLDYIICNV